MKIVSGDPQSLLGLVRKRIDERVDELETSLKDETDDKFARARSQAKQIRDQIVEQAQKDARRMHDERVMAARQEAKRMTIQARGTLEESLLSDIRRELVSFVQGKRRIGTTSYEDLVESALEGGKKKKITFTKTRSEDGIVLKAQGLQLDMRVDSLLSTLRTLPTGDMFKMDEPSPSPHAPAKKKENGKTSRPPEGKKG